MMSRNVFSPHRAFDTEPQIASGIHSIGSPGPGRCSIRRSFDTAPLVRCIIRNSRSLRSSLGPRDSKVAIFTPSSSSSKSIRARQSRRRRSSFWCLRAWKTTTRCSTGNVAIAEAISCQWPISSTRWWPREVPTPRARITSSLTRTGLPSSEPLSFGTTHRS